MGGRADDDDDDGGAIQRINHPAYPDFVLYGFWWAEKERLCRKSETNEGRKL
jgi:hypothetical protein